MANVSADAQTGVTDGDGKIQLTVDLPQCLTVTVRATGFLERRTCAWSGDVTLWPVENAAEEAATRAAAYFKDRRAGGFPGPVEIVLTPELRQRADAVAAWKEAADEVRRLTHSALDILTVDRFSDYQGWEIAPATAPTSCNHSKTVNFDIWGFCFEPTAEYFVDRIVVSPALLDRGDVALRALLRALVLSPHPLAGLLNDNRPTTELSTFERKTLHMLGLRLGGSRVSGRISIGEAEGRRDRPS